MLKQLIQQMET